MFRGLGAWHFYFTPIPVDDWNYIPGEATIQESNSILPRTKAAGKAWSKEVSGYILVLSGESTVEDLAKNNVEATFVFDGVGDIYKALRAYDKEHKLN